MKRLFGVSLALGLLSLAPAARAENMQTTQSLSAGALALGAEFQAGLVEGTPLLLNLHQSVGLRGGFDLYVREGIAVGDGNGRGVYVGAGVKWTLLSGRRDRPGIAFVAGGHYITNNYAGADAALYLDYSFGKVTPFAALDTNLDFPDNGPDFKLGLLGGVRILLNAHVAWFIEGQVGFTGSPKNHLVATGPRINI